MASLLLPVIYLAFISLGLPDSLLGSAWPSMVGQLEANLSWAGIVTMLISACTIVSSLLSERLNRKLGTGGVTAASVLLIQTILNCLGTVDILPFTGVTFPFVSNGGTSMIGAWGLLDFVKAADTRQNASFAVRLAKKGGSKD